MILRNFDQLVILSVAFMLLFTAFNTCQGFASKVLSDDGFNNLGFICLAVLYLTFAVCSLFSSAIVNKVGKLNLTMGVGAFCYSLWIACFLLPAFYGEYVKEHEEAP